MEISYSELSKTIKETLNGSGYTGVIDVDAYENTSGETLEVAIISTDDVDPLGLFVDVVDCGPCFDFQGDEMKVLQAVFGEDVSGYECRFKTLIIERRGDVL